MSLNMYGFISFEVGRTYEAALIRLICNGSYVSPVKTTWTRSETIGRAAKSRLHEAKFSLASFLYCSERVTAVLNFL